MASQLCYKAIPILDLKPTKFHMRLSNSCSIVLQLSQLKVSSYNSVKLKYGSLYLRSRISYFNIYLAVEISNFNLVIYFGSLIGKIKFLTDELTPKVLIKDRWHLILLPFIFFLPFLAVGFLKIYEWYHVKMDLLPCTFCKYSNHPVHQLRLVRVFTIHFLDFTGSTDCTVNS